MQDIIGSFTLGAATSMKEILRKKPVRITLYLLGILAALVLLLNWLIRNHTKDLIEKLIAEETNGKISLDIGKLNFSLYPQAQVNLHNTWLEVTEENGTLPAYSVRIRYIGLQMQSLRSFLFDRKLLVDYLVAEDPEIRIYPHAKPKKRRGNAILHTELGNVYVAMQRLAQTMRVQRFGIFDGKLFIGSPRPDDFPVNLTDIDFQVDEFEMVAPAEGDSSKTLNVSKLKLRTGRQDITFPNGDFRMKYASLEISSADNSVRIDSFYLSGMNQDTAYGALEAGFRNLRLVNIDFRALYEKDLLKVDSLYCDEPDLFLNLDLNARKSNQPAAEKPRRRPTRGNGNIPVKPTRNIEDVRLEKRIADLLGKLDIGYLGLINADIRINTKKGNKYTPFATKGNNFEANGIRINSDNPNPIEIDNLVFAIKNYKASTADSLYDFFFDSVAYRTGSLTLKNLRIEPSKKNTQPDKKYLSIPDFELRDISIAELVSNKRFKARELVVRNSRTVNYFVPKSKTLRASRPITEIIYEISKTVDLEKIRFENAYLLNQSVSDKAQRIVVTGINSEISANELLRAPTYELMGYSVGYLRFDSVYLNKGPYELRLIGGEVLGKEQRIRADQLLLVNKQNKTSIRIRNAVIKSYHFDDEFERLSVDSIHWKDARVTFEPGAPGEKAGRGINAESSEPRENFSFALGHIHAENTVLQYVSGDSIRAEMDLVAMDIRSFSSDGKGKFSLVDFAMDGRKLLYATPQLEASSGAFQIVESRRSGIRDLRLSYLRGADTIKATLPSLEFTPEIAVMLDKKYPVFGEIILDKPVIFAALHAKAEGTEKKERKELSADIGKIDIRQADLDIRQQGAKTMRIRTRQFDFQTDGLQKDVGPYRLSLGNSSAQTSMLDVQLNDSITVAIEDGTLELSLDHVQLGRGKDSASFSALLRKIDARNLSLMMLSPKGKAPLELNKFSLGGEDLRLDSLDKAHISRRIKANPSLYVRDINLRKTTATAELSAYGIGYRNGGRIVFADSLRYRPLISRDSFSNTLEWQKVYLDDIHTGRITIHDFDIEQLVTDSSVHIRKIEVEQPFAALYKDKRVPFNDSTIKPLPTDMLKQVQQRLRVDSISLSGTGLVYEEFNDKTNRLGAVHFKDMRALIRNVRTFGYGPKDSLYLLTYAVMEDSVRMRVHVDQSYTDSLSAFYMSVRVAPFDLTALNPMLEPLASARVVSGYLDTLQLRAIGREYIAHGKMRLYYRNLKVNILDKSNQQRKTVGTRLMNFVANLLINKKNAQKTGTVFMERMRERGFLQYWVRIVLSGALTNTGIRKNSKAEKKYRKAMKKERVPEIPDVDL
jgi:hypothetical protein